MNADNTAQNHTIKLRKDIADAEDKLKRIERTPAKNSMLASATAARLSELRTELAALEEGKSGGEPEGASGSFQMTVKSKWLP